MISCSLENYCCNGGYLVETIDFLQVEGVVSSECMPYKDENVYCYFECENKELDYKKYFCKEGSLKILVGREEI